MVRFDTYNASAHLVRQIESSGIATVTHDGGDNVLVRLRAGGQVSIHLIETIIPPYEIRLNLIENSGDRIHTLFVLWSAMFLPNDDELFRPDPWMQALVQLYGGKLYAFDVYGKDIRIFPTYFDPVSSGLYRIRYGSDIEVTTLGLTEAVLTHPGIEGRWLIADFAADAQPRKQPHSHHASTHYHHHKRVTRPPETPWEILGVARSASRDEIKRAYRRLARSFHPDLNKSPEATHLMQKLNLAYQAILRESEQ